ncbi:hypothetical protein MKW92_026340, partial [Papaver armeniacum]
QLIDHRRNGYYRLKQLSLNCDGQINGVLVCIHGQACIYKILKMDVSQEKTVAEVDHLYMRTIHPNQLKIPGVKKEKMLLLGWTAKATDIFVRSTIQWLLSGICSYRNP